MINPAITTTLKGASNECANIKGQVVSSTDPELYRAFFAEMGAAQDDTFWTCRLTFLLLVSNS